MKDPFRYRNFKVYQDAKALHRKVAAITAKFPRQFWYLGDQVNRSSLSVILNVAEGSAKRSDKDFNRYIENSLGSVSETVSGLEVAFDLSLISRQEFEELSNGYTQVANQLGGLSKKLLPKS